MSPYLLLTRLEARAAALTLAGVVGLVSWATVTRFLGVPNIWVLEVTQILFAWTCLFAASIAYRNAGHFSVSVLESFLPDTAKPVLRLVQQVTLIVLLISLLWVSLDYVAVANRRPLPLTGIRFSWVAASIPVACILMAVTSLHNIYMELRGRAAGASSEKTL